MKPSHPRILRLPRLPIFFLLSLGLSSLALASNSTVPIEYLRPMKNSVSIGVRVIGGANVTFGGPGLGVIYGTNMNDMYDPDNGVTNRDFFITNYGYVPYDNGTVHYQDSADATSTTPSRPSQTGIPANPDGRWQTSITITSTVTGATAVVTNGDYLAYDTTGNTTRNWSASSANQVGTNDADGSNYVDMSTYASDGVQPGQTAHAKSSARPGIELQFGHVIQRFKHFEWGVNFTFGISEFNAKNRQTLQADAIKYTDRYQVLQYIEDPNNSGSFTTTPGVLATGTDGNPVSTGPSFADLPYTDADGNVTTTDADGNTIPLVFSGGYENTSPLGIGGDYAPYAVNDGAPISVDGGQISGYWQVKGVYYLFRLGPMIRVPIGRQFSASLSAGYIAAWVGSKMRFQEQLIIPGVTFSSPKYYTLYDYSTGSAVAITDISKNNQKYLSGAYVDLNFEWWVSTRTGFYVGAVYEKLSNYKQQAYGRVASVKMDDGVGLHFGIMTRF